MKDSDRRTALGTMMAVCVAGSAGTAQAASPSHKALVGQVDQLMSRWAIEEVLLNYARGNDRNDLDMIRSCFWPESTHKHGRFEGLSQDFVSFAAKILGALKLTAHHISNISVQTEGNRAFSECYYHAYHIRTNKNGDEEEAHFYGRYLDLFEKRDGIWKIIRRRGLSDLTPAPLPAATPFGQWPTGQHSLHDGNDDYYAMLKEFHAGK